MPTQALAFSENFSDHKTNKEQEEDTPTWDQVLVDYLKLSIPSALARLALSP